MTVAPAPLAELLPARQFGAADQQFLLPRPILLPRARNARVREETGQVAAERGKT